jgi:GABA permease
MTAVTVVMIVANQTIGGPQLTEVVTERVAEGNCRVHLVVPVPHTPPAAIAAGLAAYESAAAAIISLPEPRLLAQERLTNGLAWLASIGAEATGEVVDGDPCTAIADAARRIDASEIIVSTLPSRISRWLKQDLPSKLAKALPVHITTVTARTDVS